MSDQSWALEKMMKHRLQVDFSRCTIDCRGYNQGWYWDSRTGNFYEALFRAVSDIERSSLKD